MRNLTIWSGACGLSTCYILIKHTSYMIFSSLCLSFAKPSPNTESLIFHVEVSGSQKQKLRCSPTLADYICKGKKILELMSMFFSDY